MECTALKRAIEVVYSATLPKASKPFIYMSISLPSEHVDVNIHPTKREVYFMWKQSLGKLNEGKSYLSCICRMWVCFLFFFFLVIAYFLCINLLINPTMFRSAIHFWLQVSLLNQESLIETIKTAVESKLMNSNTSRTFQTQVIR